METQQLAREIMLIIRLIQKKGPYACHFCQEEHMATPECYVRRWSDIMGQMKPGLVMRQPFYVLGVVENIDSWFLAEEISMAWGALQYSISKVVQSNHYFEYWRHFMNYLRVLGIACHMDLVRIFYCCMTILEAISWHMDGSPYFAIAIDLEGLMKHMKHLFSDSFAAGLECLRIVYSHEDTYNRKEAMKDFFHTLECEQEMKTLSLSYEQTVVIDTTPL